MIPIKIDYSKYGFADQLEYAFVGKKGLKEDTVREISRIKNEPEWMLQHRVRGFNHFVQRPMPQWGVDLSKLNFDDIVYFAKATEKKGRSWEEVPEKIKRTFEKLGIPEAERKFLGGVEAQYDSEVVYGRVREELEKLGVIFCDMDTAVQKYPELVKKYFGTVVPFGDNKFAALNTAVWSGGSFIFVPKGVHVPFPLQAYFRINLANMGQFERTLIIVEEGGSVHYIEGCTSSYYTADALHAAVVEIIAKPNSYVRYTTLQNWSKDVYNLVTKRAHAYENATVEWVDANIGCLAGGTKIFTNNGVKEISKIETGDFVFALDKNFELRRCKVVAKKESGVRKVYRVRTSNYREILATENHPFLVLRKTGKYTSLQWLPVSELKSGDLVAISGNLPDLGKAYTINFKQTRGAKKIRVPQITSNELMWLLGFYVGDGYFDKTRIYFAVRRGDKARKKVKQFMQKLFGLSPEEKGIVVRFNSVALVDFIKFLQLGGRAKEKRIPHWIFTLPKEQKLAFIEGYIAAVGYARNDHKNISITSVNKELLEDLKVLAISCGLDARKISRWSRKEKKPLGKKVKRYTHYFLYFGDQRLDYLPFYFTPIMDIKYAGKQPTYDIEVEDAHNFVANGFIVHNSQVTMKYPSVYLLGKNAKAEILSIAFATRGQHIDAGGKVFHFAPNTASRIISKSIAVDGGRTTYRGLVHVAKGATGAKISSKCDAMLIGENSQSDTYPYNEVNEKDVQFAHEATVGKIGDDQIFYLMSRGLTELEAVSLIVQGFLSPFTKELPLEYAVEFNRLIQLEMESSIG
jgi:Fe-S cluster assembly scaffold protein SufB